MTREPPMPSELPKIFCSLSDNSITQVVGQSLQGLNEIEHFFLRRC
jgi:hypothetical protein